VVRRSQRWLIYRQLASQSQTRLSPPLRADLRYPDCFFPQRVSAAKNNESYAPRGRGRIVFSVLAVLLAALGTWFWAVRVNEPTPSGAGPTVKGTLHLETFVLNLADPDQRSYLRVGIDLGLGREVAKGNGSSNSNSKDAPPVAEVRDTILGVLGRCRVDELLTEAGKTKLKADLLHALQERLPGLQVQEVYFTEFLIQR